MPAPATATSRFKVKLGAWADLDALHAQALEVVLRRSGLRTLGLTPAVDLTRLG